MHPFLNPEPPKSWVLVKGDSLNLPVTGPLSQIGEFEMKTAWCGPGRFSSGCGVEGLGFQGCRVQGVRVSMFRVYRV